MAALALLGSPGPGIAALIAVGRREGLRGALGFYGGLQLALALTAGLCGAGLAGIVTASSTLRTTAAVLSALYLLYLAWKIAIAPVGAKAKASGIASTPLAGFLLGVTNPKACVAFISLMASRAIVRGPPSADVAAKWLIIVGVILVVDFAWLGFGMGLRRAHLQPRAERALNVILSIMIVATTALEWLAG